MTADEAETQRQMWPRSRRPVGEPSLATLSLGEFVLVEGRSGVLVPSPPSEERLAVWFGQAVGDDPVVELVTPDRLYRWDGNQGPTYYH